MRSEPFTHTCSADGEVEGGGSVRTSGALLFSETHGRTCSCGCSDGHWITLVAPIDEHGQVHGLQVIFDTREEMDDFLSRTQGFQFPVGHDNGRD